MKTFDDAGKPPAGRKAIPIALILLLILLAPAALAVIGWMIWVTVWWFC